MTEGNRFSLATYWAGAAIGRDEELVTIGSTRSWAAGEWSGVAISAERGWLWERADSRINHTSSHASLRTHGEITTIIHFSTTTWYLCHLVL